jgi:Coenzyme PQQ synthesis protein D (PqqD)
MVSDSLHLRTATTADGAVVLDTRRGTITTLNSTGAFVWEALERGEDLTTIVKSLTRETNMHLDSFEQDVREFIDVLKQRQLLVRR